MDTGVLSGIWDIVPAHATRAAGSRHAATTEQVVLTATGGELSIDRSDISESSLDVRVAVDSLATGDDRRDQRLRSRYFFNARKHPEIGFRGEQFDEVGTGAYLVTGDLELRGVSRRVTMPLSVIRVTEGPEGETRATIVIARRINLADFRANDARDESGADRLDLEIEVAAVRRDAVSLEAKIRAAS